jgi:predicted permease
VDAVVLRGLPFPDADRLVSVGERKLNDSSPSAQGVFENMAAPQNFFDWRTRQDVFSGLAAHAYGEMTLAREGASLPENVFVPRVTADFFTVLGVAPVLGRAFTLDDERETSARVAVISYDLWQRRYGGRPDVIGSRLRAQRMPFEIIGVMPRGFAYPFDDAEPVAAWVPYIPNPDERVRGNNFGYYLHVIGRLRDGVSIEQAQVRMDQITAALKAETPRWFTDRAARVDPLHDFLTRGVRTWMMMLLAAVLFVLLIACVNLANLMLVRGTTRGRELGVRAALGASRWDLSRTLLLESVVLSLAGAALGALGAWLSIDMLRAALPSLVPRAAAIAVDLRVLAVTAGAGMVTGVAFGIAPILQFARPAATGGLNPGERMAIGGVRTRQRTILVVTEVALAVVLLVGAGLFLASFARLIDVDLGFDRRDVLTVRVRVLEIPTDPQQFSQRNRQLLSNVLDRVRGIPGVETAALLGQALPLRGDLQTVSFAIPGRVLEANADITFNQISPEYFRTLRVPLLRGRFFTDADVRGTDPVVILNEAAAARYFPDGDAIGQVVRVSGSRTVVGVVGNIRQDGPESGWRTQAFVPIAQGAVGGATLVVRTASGARGVLPAVREVVWSEFPDAAVPTRVDERTLNEYFNGLVAQRRFNMLLLTLFGVLGLSIAAAGIYGVLSYAVAQRTPEIGVRMALGARPSSILGSILAGAMRNMTAGLGVGIGAAWLLSALVERFLFETHPHDPLVYGGVLAVLTVTGLAAAFLPARRAALVDPLIAMRMD